MRLYLDGSVFRIDRLANIIWQHAGLHDDVRIYHLAWFLRDRRSRRTGRYGARLIGLIIAILGFDEAGTALLLTIFALQDSFGTACNVTGDGALTLITDTFDQGQTGKASTAL